MSKRKSRRALDRASGEEVCQGCGERIIGHCVKCAVRERYRDGDSIGELSEDFGLPMQSIEQMVSDLIEDGGLIDTEEDEE